MPRRVIKRLTATLTLGLTVAVSAIAHAQPEPQWPDFHRGEAYESPHLISSLQLLLRAHGQKIVVDGVFGASTQAAVARFQHSMGLRRTGAMNDTTWRHLVPTLSFGSRGPAVTALQEDLESLGEYCPTDGKFGITTLKAVKSVQKTGGLRRDGIVGPSTWRELLGEATQGD